MAATEDEKTTQKTNAKDDDSRKEQNFGQKATKRSGIETPVSEDDDDKRTAKNLGKTIRKLKKMMQQRPLEKPLVKLEKMTQRRPQQKPMVKLEKSTMKLLKIMNELL